MKPFFTQRALHRFEPINDYLVEQCAAIHSRSFARGWSKADIERLCMERPVRADCFVSGVPARASGFVISRITLDEAEILTIAVDASWRRSGIGGNLMRQHLEAINRCGARHVFLEVAEDNIPALRIYRREGFQQIGVRKDYYRKDDNARVSALTMKLDFA